MWESAWHSGNAVCVGCFYHLLCSQLGINAGIESTPRTLWTLHHRHLAWAQLPGGKEGTSGDGCLNFWPLRSVSPPELLIVTIAFMIKWHLRGGAEMVPHDPVVGSSKLQGITHPSWVPAVQGTHTHNLTMVP